MIIILVLSSHLFTLPHTAVVINQQRVATQRRTKATLGLYRPTPPKPGKIISGSVDNATNKKVTTAIYYSPPSAAGSTSSLSRIPLRSLSSAIATSPNPLPRNHSFPGTFPLDLIKSIITFTLPLMPRIQCLLYRVYRNSALPTQVRYIPNTGS